MAVPKKTIWEIQPHTKAKHEILLRYLQAWFPILSRYNERIIYIDGFCGPGRYKGGELGSPLVALNVAINHSKEIKKELIFWFVDERQDRVDQLRKEIDSMNTPSHFKVDIECGKFAKKLEAILDSLKKDGGVIAPTFAFIDPFGFSGIPFSLVGRILQQKKCEVFITFMLESMNRFIKHPNDANEKHIVEAFGTDKCKEIAESGNNRINNLRILYQKQLKSVAKFVRYFEMRDHLNKSCYYLFFASNNRLGHLKMKDAMWKVDTTGEFKFSDATELMLSMQVSLFGPDPAHGLAEQLRSKFVGSGKISCEKIRLYVEDETPYLRKHMIEILKKEEASGRISVDPIKADGKKRRAKSYPDEASIKFLSESGIRGFL